MIGLILYPEDEDGSSEPRAYFELHDIATQETVVFMKLL
jgi:hypothetical protein